MAIVQHTIKLPQWRRRLLLVLVLLGFGALIMRAVYLQGVHRSFYQKQGDARYSRALTLYAHRGMIKDRNGMPLAISSPVESIWANPVDASASKEQVAKLADLLEMKVSDITTKLSNQNRDFVYLKRRISPELANRIFSIFGQSAFTCCTTLMSSGVEKPDKVPASVIWRMTAWSTRASR